MAVNITDTTQINILDQNSSKQGIDLAPAYKALIAAYLRTRVASTKQATREAEKPKT